MSAVVRIDGQGSLPTFLEKTQAGLDRVAGSERNVRSAMKGISSAFSGTSSAADAAARAADVLADKFVRGIASATIVTAAKLLADQIRAVGDQLMTAGQTAEQANAGISGFAKSFSDGVSQAAALNQAVASINKQIEELNNNPIRGFISNLTGGTQALNDLRDSLKGEADLLQMTGAEAEARLAKKKSGKSGEDLRKIDAEEKLRSELDAANKITDPAIREKTKRAIQSAFDVREADFNKKNKDASELKALDAATAERDASRKYQMGEYQAAIDSKNRETSRESSKWLEKALEKLEINAKLVELQADRANLSNEKQGLEQQLKDIVSRAEGRGLEASGPGRQAMSAAEKRQAERKRQDDFKYGEELFKQKSSRLNEESRALANEADALRKAMTEEGSRAVDRTGRTYQSRLDEILQSGMIDPSMGAKNFTAQDAKNRAADEQAARENPTNRQVTGGEASGVQKKLEAVRRLLEDNLKEMRTYAHAV